MRTRRFARRRPLRRPARSRRRPPGRPGRGIPRHPRRQGRDRPPLRMAVGLGRQRVHAPCSAPRASAGCRCRRRRNTSCCPAADYPWWQDYQPVSYQLTTRRGDRAAFASMVQHLPRRRREDLRRRGGQPHGRRCLHRHRQRRIHLLRTTPIRRCRTGPTTSTTAGATATTTSPTTATGGRCRTASWSTCPTWRPSPRYVRGKLTGYLNDLVSLGVDGFRVDAAKHMPAGDLAAIVDPVTGDPYVFSEVIEGGSGEPDTGGVRRDRRRDRVPLRRRGRQRVPRRQPVQPEQPGRRRCGWAPATRWRSWTTTTPSATAGPSSPTRTAARYALAEAFMIAYPYGVPQVMSSFTFTDPEAGPPASSNGTTNAVTCGSGWACEHRWRTTANMVGAAQRRRPAPGSPTGGPTAPTRSRSAAAAPPSPPSTGPDPR